MTPEQAIARELRVVRLPGSGPTSWAVPTWLSCAPARHRVGKRWAPRGWRVVAYAEARPFTKAERVLGARIHLRRYWIAPCEWDDVNPPADAVRLDSIAAGQPGRRAPRRRKGDPPGLDANGKRPCRGCAELFTPTLDPAQVWCSRSCSPYSDKREEET